MAESGKVLALMGGESTGKSSLAKVLCQALQVEGRDVVVVPEYLREFCDTHGRTPLAEEQAGIADAQTQAIALAARKHAIVIADTSALMTAVYSARLFADASLYPRAIGTQRGYAATLLMALDLPWVADGLQRDGSKVRLSIDNDLRAVLLGHGLPFSVVHGSGPERLAAALAAVRPALQKPRSAEAGERWRWVCLNCDGLPCLPMVPPANLPG